LKYKPEVWKLKRIIDKQQRITDSQKDSHYVLGIRTIEGSGDDPRDKPRKTTKKDGDVNKRLSILEAKIKRLTKVEKDVAKLKKRLSERKK